jgi:hypothetical protein
MITQVEKLDGSFNKALKSAASSDSTPESDGKFYDVAMALAPSPNRRSP